MGNLFIKNRIPDGSKICISVGAEGDTPEDAFTAGVRLVREDGTEEIWPDEEVHPGPKCMKLRVPKVYSWRVRVEFNASGKAAIRAKVTKPDGAVFGETYEFIFAGQKGKIVRATISATTLKEE